MSYENVNDSNSPFYFDPNVLVTGLSPEQIRQAIMNTNYVYKEINNIIVISLYIPVFILAVVFNFLVIVVVYRYQHLHSAANYFLVNLSVADLLVTLVCMPIAMSRSITALWFYGLFMCKFTGYLQGVAGSSSIFSILAMSLGRYLAIRHPIIFRQVFNKRVAVCVIVFIWILAGILWVPVLVYQTTQQAGFDMHYCIEHWANEDNRRTYNIFTLVSVFAVPGSLVLAAYISMGCRLCSPNVIHSREGDGSFTLDRDSRLLQCRKRVARTLLVLAFVFSVCWMPYHLVNILIDDVKSEDQKKMINNKILPLTLWLGHVNSAANPLLYCFFSRNIRTCLWNLFQVRRRNLRNSSEPWALYDRRYCVRRPPVISKINNQDDQAAFHNGPNIDENRTISAPSNKKNKRNPSLSTSCLAVHHESRITCSPQMNQARALIHKEELDSMERPSQSYSI